MDLALILDRKFSTSEWTLNGNSYEGLTWLSDSPKPSAKTLEDFWTEVDAELKAEAQAKIDAKASAIAKLEALGLTVQEVEVAFGLTK